MMDGWDWVGGMLMMLVFWGGLVAVIVFGIRAAASPRRDPEEPTTSARTILENRFARGEISEEEFEHGKEVLASSVR